MVIREAAEMYLETILILHNRNGYVRATDIAKEMNYSKPTISAEMKRFNENGYITYDENGFVLLTDKGREIAEKIYERHNVLTTIFKSIGVSDDVAVADACRVEHYISNETFDCFKEYFKTILK